MSKPRRNHPCTCGSGKKYKKCCGLYNVVQFNPEIYNNELDQLQEELVDFALKKYEDLISMQVSKYGKNAPERVKNAITSWTILTVPVSESDETIFDLFYKERQASIRFVRTNDLFASWSKTSPSIYKIIEVTEDKVSLKDMRTEVTFSNIRTEATYQTGNLITGLLVPFVDCHKFFIGALELSAGLHNADNNLVNYYPEALASLLQPTENFSQEQNDTVETTHKKEANQDAGNNIEWDQPIYEQVANQFTERMKEKGFSSTFIHRGVLLWQNYCSEKAPKLKNPAAYAAAMDYLVHTSFVENHEATQSSVAKEYGASAGTVSTNYRKMAEVLAEKIS